MPHNLNDQQDYFEKLNRAISAVPIVLRSLRTRQHHFFMEQAALERILFNLEFRRLQKTQFVDYSLPLDFYNAEDIMSFMIQIGTEQKRVEFPYSLVVDWTATPDARIVTEPLGVSLYQMSEDLLKRTDPNLDAFLKEKPKTTNGPILRVAELSKRGPAEFCARLEHGTYYSQVRTNLTLDFRPKSADGQTLREIDVNKDRRLKTFDRSIMVNSIGVSAVLYYTNTTGRHFFAKIRRKDLAVFPSMLGSVSGVGAYVPDMIIDNLTSYAQREMLREIRRETGLKHDPDNHILSIKPLAFCRELSRGGKPQFFFLVEVMELTNQEFDKLFSDSPEGLEEFERRLDEDPYRISTAMSPEFATNFALALKYFERE